MMSPYYNAFISYGRSDSQPFATKLNNDLSEAGWKIWFDQNDIPLGVDFQNQIDDGIEKADNFLFIIAPHSINSEYCLKEINHAIRHNKRIIPLLHVEEITYETWLERNPDKTEADWEEYKQKGWHSSFPNMHPEIGRINWVYFRENQDDYQKSLTDLIELFRHQENYVSQHTQFLLKALEWERHQKQTRYLLIGKERQQAEKWLKVEFKNEQPPCIPTDNQCEFICESIKNGNNLMTQVFLSYSSNNRETMEKIRSSLMRYGITVWTSQTDIKTGKEFEEEINRGIEGADTLVLLLSPDAMESKYCQQEVSHALSLNKRLINLLIEPTDNELLPNEIRHLQYIDLTGELEEAEYQEGVDKLIKELAENAVYYQDHKILLVKALKWYKQNRNRSILLRGYNLEHSQSWLEVAGTKGLHPPTDLQVEFIAESAKQPPDSALDVFISYSRADSDFARRLNDALQNQGKTTWFDQESIATGTNFAQEINRGIEQSDNFLFVISPDSVNSPYCADEVEYAHSLNKRFVTVLHRRVNTAELHPELAKVQWLDFNRYGEDFLSNFSELVRTLDTDREYVREHTKKSQAALEWTKGDKSVDLLLRGNECNRAYEWLQEVEQQGKQPKLTEWLKEYIVASKDELERLELLEVERQQRELQKQRRDKLVLSGFLVLMTGLSIFSGWETLEATKQKNNAIEQTEIATKQKEIALARQLAAESESAVGNAFYQRGTLLAVESMNKFQKQDLDLGTADKALRRGLSSLPDFVSGINHYAKVKAVTFSVDGKYIATASDDYTARVWDAATGEEIVKVNHDAEVSAVAFSADAKYIATASDDHTARVWDAATGEEIVKVNHDAEVRAVTFAVTFSADAKYIATASDDHTARVWDAATGEEIVKVNHDAEVKAVTFSADGKYIATASDDHTARVWDAAIGKEIATITHDDRVRAVAFSADGKYIATASYDLTAGVWDAATGKEIATISHDDWVIAVAFSADGRYIATASRDKTSRVWDAATGEEIATITHDDRLWAVAFSPDAKYIATASDDHTAWVWDVGIGEEIATITHDNTVWAVAFSPDGKYIATASYDHTARVWDAATGEEIVTITHDDWVVAVAFSPDGKYIATASDDKTARVWDAATGEEITKVNHDDRVWAVAFSPNGKYIASASWDYTARVWDAATGEEIAKVNHDDRVWAVTFSPDGKYIATASGDHTARVWDAATGEEIAKVNHDNWVMAVAFSVDGKYIATASWDYTARVWDAATGEEITTITHDDRVIAVAFSADGKYIATASEDKTAGVWDTATGEEITTITHDDRVIAVTFRPDGKYIATASGDKTARVWDAATGEEITTITHDDRVWAVTFSPDGEYIATASEDKTAGVHFWKPEDTLDRACRRLSRNLTADEWKRYMNLGLDRYQKTCAGLPVHPSLLAKARKLAEENKAEEAEQLLRVILNLDDKIDLLPTTEALEQNPQAVVRQFQAEAKVLEGIKLANDGKVEEAIRLFEKAQELESDIDLNPDTKEIENDPEAVARQLAAQDKVREGVREAGDGEIEEATHIFQKAQTWQPDIDLNPKQKGEQIDPETVTRQLAAQGKVREGVRKAEDGEIQEATRIFQQAQTWQPDIDLYPNEKGKQINPEKVARWFAAKGKVRQGVQKAEDEEIEEATRIFQKAQTWQPDIDLNPNQKGKQIKPEKVARRLAAKSKVQKGVRLAAEGKLEDAIALFQKAVEWQPDIDLFPYTQEIENDPETVAQQLAAKNEKE